MHIFKMAARFEDFIETMQLYECLYTINLVQTTRQNCWFKLAEKFHMTAAEAEKKYTNIRMSYGRYLKKRKNIPSESFPTKVHHPPPLRELKQLACRHLVYPCRFVRVSTRSHASKGGLLNIHMNLITVSLMCHADSKSSVTRKP